MCSALHYSFLFLFDSVCVQLCIIPFCFCLIDSVYVQICRISVHRSSVLYALRGTGFVANCTLICSFKAVYFLQCKVRGLFQFAV